MPCYQQIKVSVCAEQMCISSHLQLDLTVYNSFSTCITLIFHAVLLRNASLGALITQDRWYNQCCVSFSHLACLLSKFKQKPIIFLVNAIKTTICIIVFYKTGWHNFIMTLWGDYNKHIIKNIVSVKSTLPNSLKIKEERNSWFQGHLLNKNVFQT